MAKRLQRSSARATSRPAASQGGGGGATATAARPRRRGGKVKRELVTDFTIQLATLSEAGIPVVKALTILEGQTRPGPFKDVLAELTEDVSGGTPLSEGMSKHSQCFDPLYASMVKAGEAGGVLDRILQRLASFREKAAAIRSKITGALIYPIVLTLVALTVVSYVIVFVIPKFQEIFASFNIGLPAVTQLLLDVSDFAVQYWYAVFGLPVLLLVGHGIGMRRGGGYQRFIHRIQLRAPVVGPVVNRGVTANFSRTFGTLVQAGVPHLEALSIVRDATGNTVVREAVEDIRRTVREGEGIARPMGETGIFDDLVVNMVDVGEETGELDKMLLKVADAYESAVDRQIDAMFKLLEPVLLVVMAIFVGFILVALFMPLMQLMSTL